MQIIDGDEFTSDKECIRLLYCNKSKWGDVENHYDLMHPMVQQVCKGKIYIRRNDIQQIEHQKQEDNKVIYVQKQTRFGEEQTKHTNSQIPEKLGPEEE
eukprot:11330023-Heterocapsa_arctica.AAC.1